MISLISPALSIAFSCPPTPAVPLPLREALVQPRQLTVQAPVDEQAADLRHEAAEQLPVGDCLEHYVLAAQGATQAARQRLALGLAERHRAAHAAPDAALGLVVELAVGGDDRLQMIGASLRRDQGEKVPGERRDPEPSRDLGR